MWFTRIVMFRFIFRVRQLSTNVLLGSLNPDYEGTSLLSKVSNRLATDTSSYPSRPEFSQIPL
jgi:hypothetical protein